jgi:DNA repair exonuclease SbcCD ATPase subunit
MQLIECNLEELLAYEKETNSVSSGVFQIPTKFGFKQIEAIDYTAYNEDTYEVITETGKIVQASKGHILFSCNKEIKVENIIPLETFIETIDGEEKVISVSNIGKNDLIDIQVEEVKEFYTASGIRSHNSTLSDVIKFAIFGKLENKKLKDMANRLNKNAYVKIDLFTSKGNVTIERGIEPGFFRLFVNGQELDKAGKRSVQEFLEEEIIEMPFYVFANTLSLSINDFKSFLRMSSFDKKAIIDKIFGLQVINQMREILKYQTKKLKENVDELSTSINAFSHSLTSTELELEELENKIKESTLEKKEQLLLEKQTYSAAVEKYTDNTSKIASKLKQLQEKKKQISEAISGDKQLVANALEKIELYENSKCPTCESDLDTDFHQDNLKEYKKTEEEAQIRIDEKSVILEKINENITKVDKLRNDNRYALANAQTKLDHTIEQLDDLGETDDHQTSSLQKMMEDFSNKISEKKSEQHKYQKTIAFYNLTEEILGEKGVKQMAIKTIIPPLNSEIGKIVKTLGIEHRISFNEEFDAKITHFGIDVSADTLSTGEMKKVDFAVLLAVIKMMKMKYPFMNMLFLDEIFSSIDGDGQYHILKILRDIVNECKMNIFVISHYPLSYTEFDYKLDIMKNNGFSTFELERID